MKLHIAVGPVHIKLDDPARRASVEFVDGLLNAIGKRFPALDAEEDAEAEVVELASRIGFVPNPVIEDYEDDGEEDGEDEGEPLDRAA